MSTAEQETSINFMRDSDDCYIYTSDTTVMTKLDKLVEKSDMWSLDEISYVKDTGEVAGKSYKTTKQMISFRSDKVTRNISPERQAEICEKARLARKHKS